MSSRFRCPSAFVSPSFTRFHSTPRTLKCIKSRPNTLQPRTLQPRASLNTSEEALFDYLAQKTSGSSRDQSRLRLLLKHVGLSVQNAWLLLAARVGDGEMVQELLNNGADPNVADTEGSTPLMRAVSRGHVGATRVLLDDGRVDVSKQNDWGYDAVIYLGSVQNSQPEAFKQISELMESRGIQSSRSELRWTQKPKRR